jgi:ParB-like chromosome segregation protein Spo0J
MPLENIIVIKHSEIQIQIWNIDKLVFYARNPRKNDAAVDRMCGSIREFGFKIPVLARSDGEVVDGHLRLKAARKLGINEIPVILCDEWTAQQVKAFRLMVNRSVTWADWDEELLSLELQELNAEEFDLSLTGFNPGEIDGLLAIPDEERANAGRRFPRTRYPGLATCGSAETIESSAEMPFARKMSLTCSATASRS